MQVVGVRISLGARPHTSVPACIQRGGLGRSLGLFL